MKRYGWGVVLFVIAILVILVPKLLNDAPGKQADAIHPHRVANVSVDDAIEKGSLTDTCLISATNDSVQAVKGFHLTKMNYGQPDKPGGKTPAITLPNQSYDIQPGETIAIKVPVKKLDNSERQGWLEYEYSYTDINGHTQTAGLGHVPGWKLKE